MKHKTEDKKCLNCAHLKKKKIYEALAEEIVKAYKQDQASQAVSKKLEVERQADSSR